jgi:hypothetical protein
MNLAQSYALRSDGAVVTWNNSGVWSVVNGLSNIVSLAVGGTHALALKNDGSVIGFGSNQSGQVGPASALSNVVEVAAGDAHSLVRFGDGSPRFTIQPISRSIYGGEAVTLTALGVGSQPLGYQWQFKGADLADATNAVLTLAHVGVANVGDYRCVLTNAFGSATSSVAQVRVNFDPPSFNLQSSPPTYAAEGFRFVVDHLSGAGPLTIWVSTNLQTWQPLVTNPPGTDPFIYLDAAATNNPQRFYRAAEWR